MNGINLLPHSEKQSYHMELTRRLVGFYSVGILCVLAIFIGLLLSINAYLAIQHTLLREQIASFEFSPNTRRVQGMELIVREFTEAARKLQGVKGSLVALHPLLREFESAIPPGVTLQGVSLDARANKGTVVGSAATRNDVIAFEERLEALEWIVSVESPLSNLIRERDISFSFGVTTKLQ